MQTSFPKHLRKHLPIAGKLAGNRRKWRETTGRKCARSGGYRRRPDAWSYWQARRRKAMMAGRRVCSGEVRRRRDVDGWVAGHLVCWFARESTGGRKKNLAMKEEQPFFKIKISKNYDFATTFLLIQQKVKIKINILFYSN